MFFVNGDRSALDAGVIPGERRGLLNGDNLLAIVFANEFPDLVDM